MLRAAAKSYPMVTAVRVKEALEAIATIVGNLLLAIRGASAITLLSAALVLGGALAAGHRHRVYDAVILKTLGATRARLIGAYTLEYLLLGRRHRPVRGAERLARRLADRGQSDARAVRLAALAGAGRRRRRGGGDGRPGACRHLLGARAEAGPGVKKSLGFATFRRVKGAP